MTPPAVRSTTASGGWARATHEWNPQISVDAPSPVAEGPERFITTLRWFSAERSGQGGRALKARIRCPDTPKLRMNCEQIHTLAESLRPLQILIANTFPEHLSEVNLTHDSSDRASVFHDGHSGHTCLLQG